MGGEVKIVITANMNLKPDAEITISQYIGILEIAKHQLLKSQKQFILSGGDLLVMINRERKNRK